MTGLDGVLDDMQSKHTVVKCNKLTETWSQWGFGILVSPITSVWQKIIPDNSEQKFVVVSVLEVIFIRYIISILISYKFLYTY